MLPRLCFVLALALFAAPTTAAAGDVQSLSRGTYESLRHAQRLAEAGRAEEALEALLALAPRARGRPYDAAVVAQNLGYAYAALQRYREAAGAFADALAGDALPAAVAQDVRLNLAQLYLFLEDAGQAARVLEQWFARAPAPQARAHLIAARAYRELGRLPKAIEHARGALRASADDASYELLLALLYEASRYAEAAELLKQMLRDAPGDRARWLRLAETYLLIDDTAQALAALEVAHRAQPLVGDDLLRLVGAYLVSDAPFDAARELDAALAEQRLAATPENLRLLADAWELAREDERAAAALERAAQGDAGAELLMRQARAWYRLERWRDARQVLERALARDDLEAPGRAHLLLGIVDYESGDRASAITAFEQAARDPSVATQARRWLDYLGD